MRQYYQPTLDKQCGQRIQSAQLLLSIRSYFTVNCRYDQANELCKQMHLRPPQLIALAPKTTRWQQQAIIALICNRHLLAQTCSRLAARYESQNTLSRRKYPIKLFIFIYQHANTRCIPRRRRKLGAQYKASKTYVRVAGASSTDVRFALGRAAGGRRRRGGRRLREDYGSHPPNRLRQNEATNFNIRDESAQTRNTLPKRKLLTGNMT